MVATKLDARLGTNLGQLPPVALVGRTQGDELIALLRANGGFSPFDTVVVGIETVPTIQEVRGFVGQLFSGPLWGSQRLYILYNVDLLSAEAATTLLKPLEEPPDYARIILVADSLERVAPTLVSRSQRMSGSARGDFMDWIAQLQHALTQPLGAQFVFARQVAADEQRVQIVSAFARAAVWAGYPPQSAARAVRACLAAAERLGTNANPVLVAENLMLTLGQLGSPVGKNDDQ